MTPGKVLSIGNGKIKRERNLILFKVCEITKDKNMEM